MRAETFFGGGNELTRAMCLMCVFTWIEQNYITIVGAAFPDERRHSDMKLARKILQAYGKKNT